MDKVLCLVKEDWFEPDFDSQEVWMDLVPNVSFPRKIEYILPLYNHPHNDVENGQNEVHYHQNTKYMTSHNYGLFKSFKNGRVVLPLEDGEYLDFRMLQKISEKEVLPTSISLISKSKLKHKCIHKGKYPHRGYDLSDEKPDKEGIITCPLHGLKFKKSGKVINF